MTHLTGIGTRIQGTTYTMRCNKPGAGGTVTTVILPMQLEGTPTRGVGFVTMGRSTTTMEELAEKLGTVSKEPNFSSFLATDAICNLSLTRSFYLNTN